MHARRWIVGFVIAVVVLRIRAQTLADLSGDAIVGIMQTFGDSKCPPTAANGQSWAPIPADTACGSVKRCDFPSQWCAFKLDKDKNPDLSTLNCQPLSADCKKAFEDAEKGSGNTGASGQRTSVAGATSARTTAEGASETTTSATGSSGAASIGSSAGTTPGGETTAVTTSGPARSSVGGETTAVTTSASVGSSVGGETTAVTSAGPPGGEGTTSSGSASSGTPSSGSESTPSGSATSETPSTPAESTSSSGETTTSGGTSPTEQPATGTSPSAITTESTTTSGSAVSGATSSAPSGGCCDFHEFCCFWASTGQCETNKPFMVQICKKSCGTCTCTGDPTQCATIVAAGCSGSNVLPGPACPCKSGDLVHKDWNPRCASWAGRGDCERNPDYMKPMCKVSCNVCQ